MNWKGYERERQWHIIGIIPEFIRSYWGELDESRSL
jgi:hypothetical protein